MAAVHIPALRMRTDHLVSTWGNNWVMMHAFEERRQTCAGIREAAAAAGLGYGVTFGQLGEFPCQLNAR
ncbi:hypothetical protein GCM10022233_42120 [Streptomyces shaanxiensis]|uniref:Uncharacterized protein n=1 Tax=Streptomyces shaanxiensis TaxID=653357 RepID=A0ABP7VBF6_9ACTN